MKHTPGPWAYDLLATIFDDPSAGAIVQGSDDVPVARVMGGTSYGHRNGSEGDANARLIAAAPELYDAVLMLLGCTDLNTDELDETSIEAIEIARKALAKAEGRE